MVLFDNTAYEYFFNPLCCKNKRIYYECILQLIEKSKSVPLLYEADARDTLVLYFRNCAYAVEDEENGGMAEEHISGRKTEMENAAPFYGILDIVDGFQKKRLEETEIILLRSRPTAER